MRERRSEGGKRALANGVKFSRKPKLSEEAINRIELTLDNLNVGGTAPRNRFHKHRASAGCRRTAASGLSICAPANVCVWPIGVTLPR